MGAGETTRVAELGWAYSIKSRKLSSPGKQEFHMSERRLGPFSRSSEVASTGSRWGTTEGILENIEYEIVANDLGLFGLSQANIHLLNRLERPTK